MADRDVQHRQFPRRLVLRGGVAGGALTVLAACGASPDAPAPPVPVPVPAPPPDPMTAEDWTYLSNALLFYRSVARPLVAARHPGLPRDLAAQARRTGRFIDARMSDIRALLGDSSAQQLLDRGVVPAGRDRIYPRPPYLDLSVPRPEAVRSPEDARTWGRHVLRTTGLALSTIDDWTDGYLDVRRTRSERVDAFMLGCFKELPAHIVDVYATLGETRPPLSNTSYRTGVRTYPAPSRADVPARPVTMTRRGPAQGQRSGRGVLA